MNKVPLNVDHGLPFGEVVGTYERSTVLVPRGAEIDQDRDPALVTRAGGGPRAVCDKCNREVEVDLVGLRHACGGRIMQLLEWPPAPELAAPLTVHVGGVGGGVGEIDGLRPFAEEQASGGTEVSADRVGSAGGDGRGGVGARDAGVDDRQDRLAAPPGVVVDDAAAPLLVATPLWGDPAPPFTYLAGPAGCGKTWAVQAWQREQRGVMLLATTGIAALNLGGTTINAALGYFDTKSLQESYTNGFLSSRLGRLWRAGVKRLVVDEVSMLEGDALTYLVKGVEEVNGRGYVIGKWTDEDDAEPPAMGLTLVGDFAQLPPVNGTFAWESPEWHRFAEPGHTITLTEIRRQSDAAFIEMLRAARVGDGRRVLEFMRGKVHNETDDAFDGPTLFAKNQQVDRYNWIRLGRVPGRDLYYESRREGDQRSEWGNPKKDPNTWGIPIRLHLKVGALVMILANQRAEGPPPQPFIYVNGDLGTVIDGDEYSALVKLHRNGAEVQVAFCRREVTIPCDSARRKELRAAGQAHKITENGKFEITGWIEYLPLRVGYGSTVHKSQGLSLDAVQVNIRDAFFKSPGMLYVALSRARTAGGLRLVGSEAALVERCVADPRLKDWL